MITKAFIVKKLNTNKYLVRIPYLEDTTGSSSLKTASLLEATAVMNPGTLDIYKEGDCVFISFEGGNKGKPVIIGLLYKGNEDKEPARAHQYNDSLTITNKAKLPTNTTIGSLHYNELINKLNNPHEHPISEIINLQEALDSKASINHEHKGMMVKQKATWSNQTAYKEGNIVWYDENYYHCKKDVPANSEIPLTNETYWENLNQFAVNANHIRSIDMEPQHNKVWLGGAITNDDQYRAMTFVQDIYFMRINDPNAPDYLSSYIYDARGKLAALTDLTNYSLTTHTHDDRYYTEYEMDTKLAGKSDTTHNHNSLYAALSHIHSISQVTGLQAALDGKASSTHNHNDTYASITHDHDDRYYTESEVNLKLDAKADSNHNHDMTYAQKSHNHEIAEVEGLQVELDSKASALTEAQLKAVNSGIDIAKVTKYEGYDAGKQNVLTEAQQSAVDSGISASKVSQYDNYATEKQDKLSPSQQSAVDSGITEAKVSKYDGYEASIAEKQDKLSTAQQNAIDSGITSAKVSSYDEYSTSKQDKLSAEQQNAVDSGITSEKVATYDAMVSSEKGMPLLTAAQEVNFTTENLVYAVADGILPEQTGYDLTITTKDQRLYWYGGGYTDYYDNFYYRINDSPTYTAITYPVTNQVIPNVVRVAFYYDLAHPNSGSGGYRTITGNYTKVDDYYWLDGPISITFQSSYPCFVKGTKITLADRTYKNVEDITYDDELLVWDFDKGEFTTAKPIWIMKQKTALDYNKLVFSDGSVLKTVGQHRILNKEQGKFTYPMTNDTPIGTTTFNDKGEFISLVSKEVVKGKVNYYNIITDYHLNLFASSILTSCRLSNLYPISDMKYVKDDRELHNPEIFNEVSPKWISGLRLLEQPLDINRDGAVKHDNTLVDYVKRLESIKI